MTLDPNELLTVQLFGLRMGFDLKLARSNMPRVTVTSPYARPVSPLAPHDNGGL